VNPKAKAANIHNENIDPVTAGPKPASSKPTNLRATVANAKPSKGKAVTKVQLVSIISTILTNYIEGGCNREEVQSKGCHRGSNY
jgi:hypothetical protein